MPHSSPRDSARNVARAFAPGNISGLFKIIPHEDPARMHSLGWGFTVRDGVDVRVARADSPATRVRFNGAPIDFPTVSSALSDLAANVAANVAFDVEITSALPLSSGFGLSGAATFASLIAADQLLQLDRTRAELAMIAHVAEVRNLTGLGDVCSQFNGGCLVKTRVGNPLAATRIAIAETPVHWRYFDQISTREILADHDRHQRINAAADRALATIDEAISARPDAGDAGAAATGITFPELIAAALDFAETSGLLTDDRVRRAIAQSRADGGAATMIMLGNAVFSTVPFPGSTETALTATAAHLKR